MDSGYGGSPARSPPTSTIRRAAGWPTATWWRPDLELPPAVRWLRDYKGPPYGVLVAAFAKPGAGRVAAVQLINVDAEGQPINDKEGPDGLDKRTYGQTTGAVCVLGVVDGTPGVTVAEGLADTLALAARLPWPAVCLGGTAGFSNIDVAHWLAGFGTVQVWADEGTAGLEAASALKRGLQVFDRAASVERVSRETIPERPGRRWRPSTAAHGENTPTIYSVTGCPHGRRNG